MFALVSPEKTHLPPGSVVRLPVTWEEYQAVSQQRGDSSIPGLKYRHGELLLRSPLPHHGKDASLIADVIKTLLDHAEREYDSFTPITMELPKESGIEPDYCFYIDNWEAVVGKKRINWRTDPPPDLALGIDVTSYSDVNDYLPYGFQRFGCSSEKGYGSISFKEILTTFKLKAVISQIPTCKVLAIAVCKLPTIATPALPFVT